jgi:threonine dehydratase
MISHADVVQAAARIAGHIRKTPLLQINEHVLGFPAMLKLDTLQHTGAFKVRGALNAVLAAAERGQLSDVGVIAASGGNHGLAVAYAARIAGVPAEIFVPETTPKIKVNRLYSYGATVRLAGREISDAFAACAQRQAETGAFTVHAFNQPEVIAGQGTVALEVLEATQSGIDTIIVAVGGGGLVAGVHIAVGPNIKVIAVEPEGIPTLHQALSSDSPVDVTVQSIAADALGAWRLGDIPWKVLRTAAKSGVVHSVVVGDGAIRATQHALWDQLRVIAEPGGATAAAALLSGAYQPEPGERVVVVVCGANTDPTTFTPQATSAGFTL